MKLRHNDLCWKFYDKGIVFSLGGCVYFPFRVLSVCIIGLVDGVVLSLELTAYFPFCVQSAPLDQCLDFSFGGSSQG